MSCLPLSEFFLLALHALDVMTPFISEGFFYLPYMFNIKKCNVKYHPNSKIMTIILAWCMVNLSPEMTSVKIVQATCPQTTTCTTVCAS